MKHKVSNCDKTQKLKIEIKLKLWEEENSKNSKCDKTQIVKKKKTELKPWQTLKTQNMKKI